MTKKEIVFSFQWIDDGFNGLLFGVVIFSCPKCNRQIVRDVVETGEQILCKCGEKYVIKYQLWMEKID